MCLPAQVQVLSAALKAAQQERQSEDTEGQSECQPPEDGNGAPDEEFSQKGGTAEEEQTPNEPRQQTTDSAPIEELKETEAETEAEAEPQVSPESSPDSLVLVRDDSDHSSVVSRNVQLSLQAWFNTHLDTWASIQYF